MIFKTKRFNGEVDVNIVYEDQVEDLVKKALENMDIKEITISR